MGKRNPAVDAYIAKAPAYARPILEKIREAFHAGCPEVKEPKLARPKKTIRVTVPADLRAALARSAKARSVFEGFPPSHKREYVEWIVEAKRPETRATRVKTTIEWLAKGKHRNWKYERKA